VFAVRGRLDTVSLPLVEKSTKAIANSSLVEEETVPTVVTTSIVTVVPFLTVTAGLKETTPCLSLLKVFDLDTTSQLANTEKFLTVLVSPRPIL